MIIDPSFYLDPVFNGVTHAWPLNENTNKMRREVMGTGADFFPQGVTLVSGKTKFSGSTNSYMTAPDIGIALSTDQAFTWCFIIRPSSLSGTEEVLCKGETVFSANAEYRIYLSNNTLNFRIYGATITNTVSATLTNGSDNFVCLVHDPIADIISIKVNAAAPVTAAHSDGCRFKYGSLMMGNTAGGPFVSTVTPPYTATLPGINTTSIDSAMSNVIFWKGTALTATQQATVRTILTTTGFPWSTLSEVDYTLDPDTLPLVSQIQRYDFSDLSTQWQDTSGTVPVTANNDPIRRIDSLWGLGEAAIAPSDAVRPLCKTNTINTSLPTAYSNGVDTQMNLNNPLQTTEADFALFIVAKNDANSDATKQGTHWMSHVTNGAMYIAQVGYNNPGYVRGYLAAHKSDGVPPDGPVNSSGVIYPADFNVLELKSVSQVWNAISNGYVPLSGARDIPNVNPVDYDLFFKPATSKSGPDQPKWWAWGNIAEMIFIQATLTVNERARIRKFLDLKYGLTSAYMGY